MPLLLFIVHAGPAQLRLLCALGCACGLVVFLFGLRRKPSPQTKATATSDETSHAESLPAPEDSDHLSQPADSMPQVIRLSLPAISVRSTDMTQQQKVAAALIRAGAANSAGWNDSSLSVDPPPPKRGSSTTVLAEVPRPPAAHSITPATSSDTPASRTLRHTLLLIGGTLLALVSLYFLFRVH